MGLVDLDRSETMEQTKAAMLDVTSRGMNVMLKPHVESLTGDWRAEIAPTDTNVWFPNYKAMMLQYAQLAQETGAPMLCIGTEMKSLSGAAIATDWVDLIDSIREVYDGLITYAATYDEAAHVTFWDKVDYIGIDAYVPLTYSNDPNRGRNGAGLDRDARQRIRQEHLRRKIRRRVLQGVVGAIRQEDDLHRGRIPVSRRNQQGPRRLGRKQSRHGSARSSATPTRPCSRS